MYPYRLPLPHPKNHLSNTVPRAKRSAFIHFTASKKKITWGSLPLTCPKSVVYFDHPRFSVSETDLCCGRRQLKTNLQRKKITYMSCKDPCSNKQATNNKENVYIPCTLAYLPWWNLDFLFRIARKQYFPAQCGGRDYNVSRVAPRWSVTPSMGVLYMKMFGEAGEHLWSRVFPQEIVFHIGLDLARCCFRKYRSLCEIIQYNMAVDERGAITTDVFAV